MSCTKFTEKDIKMRMNQDENEIKSKYGLRKNILSNISIIFKRAVVSPLPAHPSATFNVKAAISKKRSKFNCIAKPLIG